MFERLETMKERLNEIDSLLATPDITNNLNKFRELAKEASALRPTIKLYERYIVLKEELVAAEELLKDKEYTDMAKEEINELTPKIERVVSNLEIALLPKDPNDFKNVIMEIRGAAGGDEANIFAGDLFRMYTKFAEDKGWKIEVLNSTESSSGGFTLIEFLINGEGAYSYLKYESGSHRVQRVPVTETQGRVHTSTATVLTMPEAEDIDIEINENDIKTDVFRSGGAGGQSVNTTDSAVRLTHIPTGTVVTCQNERSQLKNKESALKILKTRIYEQMQVEQENELGSERKNKIGSGDRSEKIRTYNYPQNRVTDHRISFTTKQLDRVMDGKLDEIINALIHEDMQRKLKNEI